QSYNFSQTTLPDWLNNASQGAIQQAQTLSQRPYDPYTGQIVAQPGADTAQAYQQVRDMQGSYNPAFQQSAQAYGGLLGQVNPLTAGGINDISNQLYGNYQQNVMNPATGLLSGYLGNASPATAGQVTSNALNIMTPFSQAVIDPALQIGRQQLAQNLQQVAGQANNVGAFGGSRQGITEGVAQAQAAIGAGQTVGNLLNQGWQSALSPAYNLANQASQQGYGAAGLLAGMGQSGYNAAATAGQNMANTNLQAGLTAAQNLPAQALQQQQAQQRDASLLQTIGAAQQNQQQQQINAQMGQHYEAQDWPVQNLDMLLSAVGAVPYGSTTMSYGRTQPDPAKKNVAGSILGGAASGASTGFMVGGPIGAGVGAVGGGILGALN
ncbi:MAG TPA: hypothetical protein VGH84_01035, partial [Steroidobacteraceae bacterium]